MTRKTLWLLATVAAVVLFSIVVVQRAGEAGEKAQVTTAAPAPGASPYLFVWVGDKDRKKSDFLAVIDADPQSKTYGKWVASAPVGAAGTMPHHTEGEFPKNGFLLANGWVAGRTYLFDLTQPTSPKVAHSFTDVGEYSFPHSYARLPNGNVLAVFQSPKGPYVPGGGLVEMDERGKLVRSASAVDPKFDVAEIWPYSVEIDAARDRVITINSPMGMPEWARTPKGSWSPAKLDSTFTSSIQLWRLSDLSRTATIRIPESGKGRHHIWPAEARVLADGSAYLNTFTCGLYHLTQDSSGQPKLTFVHAFKGGTSMHDMCGVPVLIGKYWVQTVPAIEGLVVLDLSSPAKPVEVSRLKLEGLHMPHWIAADRRGSRVVVTGGDQGMVMIANLDPNTGKLTLDDGFKDENRGTSGVHLTRARWPHGEGGNAIAHGALFGPR